VKFHSTALRAEGGDPEEVHEVTGVRELRGARLTRRERLILEFCRQAALNANAIAVQAIVEGEDRQLEAMERFVVTKHLDNAMREHDWPGFALRYNGANFAEHEYDKKLEAAFASLVATGLPDVRVRAAQAHLVYRGFNPGAIDGVMGPRTRAALQAFQQKVGLASTGEADDSTLEQLTAA
jgi:hypothetical protein